MSQDADTEIQCSIPKIKCLYIARILFFKLFLRKNRKFVDREGIAVLIKVNRMLVQLAQLMQRPQTRVARTKTRKSKASFQVTLPC